MVDDTLPGLPRLAPLPYHEAIVKCLQVQEPDIWQWISSAQARSEHAQTVRSELLKETYRLDVEAHPELHQCCMAAAQRLGLSAPVTLYQSGDGAMNASLYYVPGEAHVVFTGPLLERLRGAELEAVLGHELSHYVLWELDGGVYHTADRLLSAVAQDPRADASHLQTARLFRLYTEIYADRGGAVACGALLPSVNALVKTQTGLTEISAAHYLKQADEICAPDQLKTVGQSHPEIFVRARALRLWCEGDVAADDWLATALQGPLVLDQLDMLAQQRLTGLTRRILSQLLRPRCLRSDGMLAHARRFFADFRPDEVTDAALDAEIKAAPGAHDYVAYLLIDFAVADRDLEDVPLAASLELAQRWGLADTFERIALKELALPKRQFNKLKQGAAALLAQAEQLHG
jgi:predicted SprT family Zn-dependent metalloprotease